MGDGHCGRWVGVHSLGFVGLGNGDDLTLGRGAGRRADVECTVAVESGMRLLERFPEL